MSDIYTLPARPTPPAVPAMIQLPPPPAAVTSGVAALRVACAQWAPNPGSSDHKTELQVCDTVLNRATEVPFGVAIGVLATLAVVAFVGVTRGQIRTKAYSRGDNIVLYGTLVLLGIGGGYVASGPLIWCFAGVWSDGKCQLAVAGCIAGMVGLLAVLRWKKQRVAA